MTDTVDSGLPQDELTTLKARADLMGVSYHPSIGLDKLREKVNASLTEPVVEAPVVLKKVVESENQAKIRLRKECSSLVRVRLTCMNPAKKEWEGELFTGGNSVVGTFTKYVPFNNDEGWHIPRIILNIIDERKCQIFYTVVDSRGNKSRKGKLIKEFAVEVMPDLTASELHDLAQRQAMGNTVGN